MLDNYAAHFSPDGQQLLLQTGTVASLDGATVYNLPINETCPQAYWQIHNWDWSPDKNHLAYLLTCPASQKMSWLYLIDATVGDVLWELEITATEMSFSSPPQILYFSTDGMFILLDELEELPLNSEISERSLSPIWRISVDGQIEIEPVIEHGFLLGVIEQWHE